MYVVEAVDFVLESPLFCFVLLAALSSVAAGESVPFQAAMEDVMTWEEFSAWEAIFLA